MGINNSSSEISPVQAVTHLYERVLKRSDFNSEDFFLNKAEPPRIHGVSVLLTETPESNLTGSLGVNKIPMADFALWLLTR